MRIESKRLPLSKLEQNTGQIEGLPANPRTWTKGDIERLAKSLKDTPELFDARPILVVPQGDKFVILGGNLRYDACRHNKAKDVPCIVAHDLTVDKMAQIVLKDNGDFGSWNYALLSEEWDDIDFKELGIVIPKMEDFSGKNQEINPGTYSENITLKLKYHEPTASLVLLRLGENKKAVLLAALNYAD